MRQRTGKRIRSAHYQGDSGPSQLRYANYIEEIVICGVEHIVPPKSLVTSIKIRTLPLYQKVGIPLSFMIESLGTIQFDHDTRHGVTQLSRNSEVSPEEEFTFDTDDTLFAGAVCILF